MSKEQRIADQKKYLEDKLKKTKWRGQLTRDQVEQITSGIEAGDFLEKHALKKVMHDSNAKVREAVHDAAKETVATRTKLDEGKVRSVVVALREYESKMRTLWRAQFLFQEALNRLDEFEFVAAFFGTDGSAAVSKANAWCTGVGGTKIPRPEAVTRAADTIQAALDADVVDWDALEKLVKDGEHVVQKCMVADIEVDAEMKKHNANIAKYINRKTIGAIAAEGMRDGESDYKKYNDRIKGIKLMQKALHKLAEFGAQAADAFGFGWAVEFVDVAVTDFGGHAAKEHVRSQAKDHASAKHGITGAYEMLNDNPLLIPQAYIAKQKERVELFLKAITPALNMAIPEGADYVVLAIKTAAFEYLDTRLRLVEEKYGEKAAATEEEARKQRLPFLEAEAAKFREKVDGLLHQELDPKTVLATANKVRKFGLEKVVEKLLERLVKEATRRLLTYFPPDPAQDVTGDDLNNALIGLIKTEYRQVIDIADGALSKAPEVPDRTNGGTPVVGSEPSQTKDGRFWVTVEHDVVGRLRGYLGSDGTFEPLEPSQSNIESANWGGRSLNVMEGYVTEGDGKVYGTWYHPWPDRKYWLFVTRDGRHLWASYFSKLKYGNATVASELDGRVEMLSAFEWPADL